MKQELKYNKYLNLKNIIIAILLIIIACLLLIIACLKSNFHRSYFNKYPLIDPARNIIRQENFLTTIEPLRRNVKTYLEKEDVNVSVYIEYLNTGSNIRINPEVRYWPASLSKLPIAIASMSMIEDGEWALDHKLTLREEDREVVSSDLNNYPEGSMFTVGELLKMNIVNSDNTAYKILYHNLPKTKIDQMVEAVGIYELFDKEGRMSAYDYSRFFRILYNASFLSRENSQYLLELLNETKFNDFLREPIPSNIPFPHKFGFNSWSHAFNDSGIVYIKNRPYLITIMMQGGGDSDDEDNARRIMNNISRMSYEYFSQAK